MTKLTLEEMETAFVQSAQDRRDGIWNVWSNDPYWLRRLEQHGEPVDIDGQSGWYRIQHRQLTMRSKRKKAMSEEHLAALQGEEA